MMVRYIVSMITIIVTGDDEDLKMSVSNVGFRGNRFFTKISLIPRPAFGWSFLPPCGNES